MSSKPLFIGLFCGLTATSISALPATAYDLGPIQTVPIESYQQQQPYYPPAANQGRRNLTPEQRLQRQQRRQDLTPEERAQRRLRRQERERQQAEQDRLQREQEARDQAARDRAARNQAERDRIARENQARQQAEWERQQRIQAEAQRLERERLVREQAVRDQAARNRAAQIQAEQARIARENAARQQIELQSQRVVPIYRSNDPTTDLRFQSLGRIYNYENAWELRAIYDVQRGALDMNGNVYGPLTPGRTGSEN